MLKINKFLSIVLVIIILTSVNLYSKSDETYDTLRIVQSDDEYIADTIRITQKDYELILDTLRTVFKDCDKTYDTLRVVQKDYEIIFDTRRRVGDLGDLMVLSINRRKPELSYKKVRIHLEVKRWD